MFSYKKVFVAILIIILATPTVSAAGSITASLIQGKTFSEAVYILAEQINDLTDRVEDIENSQEEALKDIDALREADQKLIEQQREENETLQQDLAEQQIQIKQQEQQREMDRYCDELEQAGNQYLPTKQPIKELYENLLRQNSETFEDAYAKHQDNGAKVLSREEYREQWETGQAQQKSTLSKLAPHYNEYMELCL